MCVASSARTLSKCVKETRVHKMIVEELEQWPLIKDGTLYRAFCQRIVHKMVCDLFNISVECILIHIRILE